MNTSRSQDSLHEDLCRVGIFVWVRRGQRDVVALRGPDRSREVDTARVKAADQLHEFAAAVKALATDESLSHEDLRKELCVLAGHVLHPSALNRRSQIRQ